MEPTKPKDIERVIEELERWKSKTISLYCRGHCRGSCCYDIFPFDKELVYEHFPELRTNGAEADGVLVTNKGIHFKDSGEYFSSLGHCGFYDADANLCIIHEDARRPQCCIDFPFAEDWKDLVGRGLFKFKANCRIFLGKTEPYNELIEMCDTFNLKIAPKTFEQMFEDDIGKLGEFADSKFCE